MWDVVGIIAAVVVIVLLLQVLDVSEVLKAKLKGETAGPNLEHRVAELERRLDAVERKGF